MPRSVLTITLAIKASQAMPETRISAQTRPSTVDSASEPSGHQHA
jgi:hypothetical protein